MTKNLERKCEIIREKILEINDVKPIHLSSNLGVVEISVVSEALLGKKPNKIIYDIGHQSYAQKILNKSKFKRIREHNGPSGFCDVFVSGHSGNALSAALGMSYEAKGITTVIVGDAGFINGQTLEALNNLFLTKQKIIVVLNDNNMSISPAIKSLNKNNEAIFLNKKFLETITTRYVGIIDGNSVRHLLTGLSKAKKLAKSGPVIVHCITKKGRGLADAENDVVGKYHMQYQATKKSFSDRAGKTVGNLILKNKDIYVVNSAMTLGTGCQEICDKFPKNYFDVGIAENHAMSFAVGLKLAKKIPICFYYSTFLQRSYDQIINDAVNNKTHFLTLIDRADLSPGDGQTHHGIHDLGFLKNIPNSLVCSPRSLEQLEQLIILCLKEKKHTFIRYPREMFSEKQYLNFNSKLKLGEWETVVKKKQATSCLVSYGPYIDILARDLSDQKIDIINAAFITNYKTNIKDIVKKYKNIFVYERTLLGHLVNDFYKVNKTANIFEFNYKKIPSHGSLEILDKKNKMNSDYVVRFIKKII